MISHAFLDLDGVLVDFASAAARVHGINVDRINEWDIAKCCGVTPAEFWGVIDSNGFVFWSNLKPYPWLIETLALLNEFCPGDWTVATSPSRNPSSAAGKVAWMDQHLKGPTAAFRRYMIGEHKYLLAATGRVLIDDSERNVETFRAFGGNAILFPQPWNENRHICGERMEYLRHQLEKYEKAGT